jgi:prepilin-type N-terminal cleavage/methylation domain-containing protein
MKFHGQRHTGFSLIELVIVVVIIGIIAAIAIPRLSRGSAGAADSATAGNLAVLRSAIDLFATEHGGLYPTVGTFDSQLTEYSDSSGSFSATKTATAIYGPYLRKVPPLPVGPVNYKGVNTIIDGGSGTPGTSAGGWFYNAATGDIKANLPDAQVDTAGKQYNEY